MPSWPAELPARPLIDGYTEQAANNVLRTNMEHGKAKTRRRFTAVPEEISGTLSMSAAQYTTFRDYMTNDLADGALPVDWDVRDQGVESVLFVSWQAALNGIRWRVTFNAEILP